MDKNTFETDFGGWTVENSSWSRKSIDEIKKKFPFFPDPPDKNSKVRKERLKTKIKLNFYI